MSEPLSPPFDFTNFRSYYPNEPIINLVRHYRNYLLLASDWTQLSDAPVDRQAWADYRQALRDFMDTYDGTEANPVFPPPPA